MSPELLKQTLSSYLRRELGGGKVKKIKFVDSRKDNLIQLADMCVGAITRSYKPDTRRNHDKWKRMIEGKIADTWDVFGLKRSILIPKWMIKELVDFNYR